MRGLILILVACTLCPSLHAQTIEGTVYDTKTKEPIVGVVIYLDGTSIVTTSDINGSFRLVVGSIINTTMVLSHLSYESLIVEKPFEHREKTFYLKEKMNLLEEAKVVADRFSRADKMRVFKEQFLGTSAAGKSCIIVNEEDIVLNYDHATNTLVGFSNNPIIVENRYLAYRVIFDLRRFIVQYSKMTLQIADATKVLYKGTSSFFDQSPFNIMIAKRREETYLRSSQYFWRNFVAEKPDNTRFKIYNRYRQIDVNEYFIVSDIASQKRVMVIPETNLNKGHHRVLEGTIYGVISVQSNRNYRSEVVFLTNHFFVDQFGNPDPVDHLMFFGDMGDQRLGDMLPMDFVYNPSSRTSR